LTYFFNNHIIFHFHHLFPWKVVRGLWFQGQTILIYGLWPLYVLFYSRWPNDYNSMLEDSLFNFLFVIRPKLILKYIDQRSPFH
jgi:hypothetical protein